MLLDLTFIFTQPKRTNLSYMIVKISKSHTSEASPINQELERLGFNYISKKTNIIEEFKIIVQNLQHDIIQTKYTQFETD